MNNSNDQFIGYDRQIISSVYLENKYLFNKIGNNVMENKYDPCFF